MGILSVWFLVILYIMSGTIMAIMSYNDIKQKPYKRYFNIIQCMYVFVYSIVPVLVHSYCYANGNNEHAYAALDYSNNGIKLFYYSWAMSVIGYCGLRFGNNCVFGKRSSTINGGDSRQFTVECSSKTWFIAATICLIVGIIAEMLWTKAY